MAPLQPEGENLRKAVKWVSAELKADKDKKLAKLLEEAAVNFNLSPMDAGFLERYVGKGE